MTIKERCGIINIENERKVVKAMKNFSFEKNKNIYIIRYKEWELCMDIEKEIIVNEKTGEIVEYNAMRTIVFEDLAEAYDKGRSLSDHYENIDKTGKNVIHTGMETEIFNAIERLKEKELFFSKIRQKDKLYSLALSNPNLLVSLDFNGDISEGFMDFCLKNDLIMNRRSYEKFQLSKKINDYPEDIRLLAAEYIEEINDSKLPKENIVKILRAYRNSVLKYGGSILNGSVKLRYTLTYVSYFPELIKLIDTQSSFVLTAKAVDKNYNLLRNKEQQEKIEKSQKRIKELETLAYKDYWFIVPTTLEELIDEGKQQNNCVGSFYNDSMAKGEDFIYFIRKKNEPKKSYITCRFNIKRNETKEARYRFNDSDIREEDKEAILKSEDFIRKIVKEKGIKTNIPIFTWSF